MASFKEKSKQNWEAHSVAVPIEKQVEIGCLQRIADATEMMASNYQKLINDRDFYKRRYEEEVKSSQRMARRIAAYQGVIKRMKKTKA